MVSRADTGIALLEALVALTIVGVAGATVVGLLGAGVRAERDAIARERALSAAERLLAAHALLRREELDRRIGRQASGEYVVSVQRPERALYRLAVATAVAPHIEELVTVVYRPDPAHAP